MMCSIIGQPFYCRASIVVEHSATDPAIEGSKPAAEDGEEEKDILIADMR
jgi:hypothetical protein